ncbi:MAG: hypothetical protein AAFN78_19215, partial [Pseudomonadota bacterium]
MNATASARDLFSAEETRQWLDALVAGHYPDSVGRYGPFGGRYVPETLVPAFERLQAGIAEHLD